MKRLIFIALMPLMMMAGCENEDRINEDDLQLSLILTDSAGNECYTFDRGDTIVFLYSVKNMGDRDIYFDDKSSNVVLQGDEFGKIYRQSDGAVAASTSLWIIDEELEHKPHLLPADSTWQIAMGYPEFYSGEYIPSGEYFTNFRPRFVYYDSDTEPDERTPLKELNTDTLTEKFKIL